MTDPIPPGPYAIGACLTCLNLTFLTPERTTCLICGTPPDLTLSLPDPTPPPESPPAPAEEGGSHPDGGETAVGEGEAGASTAAPLVQPYRDAVAECVIDYAMGEAVTADEVVLALEDAGASHDAAVTAAGRLSAIRSFLDEEDARVREEGVRLPPPAPAASEPAPDQPV